MAGGDRGGRWDEQEIGTGMTEEILNGSLRPLWEGSQDKGMRIGGPFKEGIVEYWNGARGRVLTCKSEEQKYYPKSDPKPSRRI
jgi:hypothetical protein